MLLNQTEVQNRDNQFHRTVVRSYGRNLTFKQRQPFCSRNELSTQIKKIIAVWYILCLKDLTQNIIKIIPTYFSCSRNYFRDIILLSSVELCFL